MFFYKYEFLTKAEMFNFADEILFYKKFEMKSLMCERSKGAIT